MRELILKRIEEIRNNNRSFPKSEMRWQKFIVTNGDGDETHISDMNFESLKDDELLTIFELIIRRISKIM